MSEVSIVSNQYLTFTLDDEYFAIEIPKVSEVLDYTNITRVPRTPDFMRGVINLRGNVVPVVDLRLCLGMSGIERTVDTCIIIAELNLDSELFQFGMLADSVQEVIEILPSQIEPAPRLGTRLNTEFIRGMGKREERFVVILDIDKVLSHDELSSLQESSSSEKQDKELG